MSDLVAIAYPDLATAADVTVNLAEAQREHLVELDDLVIVERKANGKVKLHQPSTTGAGAASGAIWGGLIGMIFFMPLLGMALGASTGALSGALTDVGVDDSFLRDLGDKLPEGGAAVIALVREATPDKLLAQVKHHGEVIQTSLSGDAEQAVRDALAAA